MEVATVERLFPDGGGAATGPGGPAADL